MEELLTLKPDDLRSVRLANDLEKRSSAWPYGWGTRFVVLSANFLYVYNTSKVRKRCGVVVGGGGGGGCRSSAPAGSARRAAGGGAERGRDLAVGTAHLLPSCLASPRLA